MALLLMRHGPTNQNPNHVSAHTNAPLSAEGHQIAAHLATKAQAFPLKDLHASDLTRAADTAKAVGKATGHAVSTHHALRSWNLGKLAGQPTKKVLPLIKALVQHPDMKAPGGESFNSFMRRFLPYIAPLLADKDLHGVVTHTRNIKTLEALIAGKGTLDPDVLAKESSLQPGDMAYADESRFEPLLKEKATEKASAGS